MPTTNPLLEVLHFYHQRLNHLLLCQQEALIEQKLSLALSIFEHYQALQTTHIEVENEVLLPLHQQLTGPQWPSSLYEVEHNKILKLVSRTQKQLQSASAQNNQNKRRLVIELLDYQRTLKNVLEHHEQREEKGLIPELVTLLDARHSEKVAQECKARWQHSFDHQKHVLNSLLSHLGVSLRS